MESDNEKVEFIRLKDKPKNQLSPFIVFYYFISISFTVANVLFFFLRFHIFDVQSFEDKVLLDQNLIKHYWSVTFFYVISLMLIFCSLRNKVKNIDENDHHSCLRTFFILILNTALLFIFSMVITVGPDTNQCFNYVMKSTGYNEIIKMCKRNCDQINDYKTLKMCEHIYSFDN